MSDSVAFTRDDILRLFDLLNAELAEQRTVGEVYVVGGAVMCLALDARRSTRDVDALFRPTSVVRKAAARVAASANLPRNWLNDAAKGFLGKRGDYDDLLELSHLRVFVAQPAYLLAMKCAAMRLGAEYHDVEDVRFLLRLLNITEAEEAMRVVTRYFDEAQLLPKTRLALEELLPSGAGP